jgi:hypothetical protein
MGMMDQHRNQLPDNPDAAINDNDADLPSRTGNSYPPAGTGLANVTALVRSLQRRAGLEDCFRRGHADCDRMDCDWRMHCVDIPTDLPTGPDDDEDDPSIDERRIDIRPA